MKVTLEHDTKRWRYGWCQLRSRIEWLESKKQQGSSQSCGPVVIWWVSRRGARVSWEPGHVMPGLCWHQLFSVLVKEWRASVSELPILFNAFFFRRVAWRAVVDIGDCG